MANLIRGIFVINTNSEAGPARSLKAGDVFMIGAVLAWGINFPVSKSVLAYMDPLVFSATRYFAASLLLFGFLFVQRVSISISLREAGSLALIGLLGIMLFQGGWAYGLSLTSASKASVLITTSPIFGALISALRGQSPSLKACLGIGLSFFGVVIVINDSLTEVTIGFGSILGDIFIIGASLMWAIYTFVSRPIVSRRGPVVVTAWAMLFGATMLGIAAIPALGQQNWSAISVEGWLAWTSTAIFAAALAFVWYCAGVARIGITRGMAYSYFIPVIAILTSVLFFGETMSLVQIFGALIVLFGVNLTRTG